MDRAERGNRPERERTARAHRMARGRRAGGGSGRGALAGTLFSGAALASCLCLGLLFAPGPDTSRLVTSWGGTAWAAAHGQRQVQEDRAGGFVRPVARAGGEYGGPVDPARAKALLTTSVERVLDLLKSPNYTNPATRSVVVSQIEDEVYHIFDFAAFSARTLGQAWERFSPQERQDFTDAFATLLFSTYLSRIDGYNGESVEFTEELGNRAGTRVEIRTRISMADGRKVPVFYRMMARGSDCVVYDVLVEGVSLVNNYRSQFLSILQTSSPAELIERVRESAVRERG